MAATRLTRWRRQVDGEREEGRRRGSVAGVGGDKVLQLEEETGEVRRGPKGVDGGGTVELTRGGEEEAMTQNTVRGGGGSATGTNKRLREGEGSLWCASKG
jgi:hypothetical protein